MTPRFLWVWYSPFGLGGVETFLLRWCRAARRRGWPVAVAAVATMDGPNRGLFERLGVSLFDWTSFAPAFAGRNDGAEFRQRMAADLAEFRPTVLALNDARDFALGATSALPFIRRFTHIVDTLHNAPPWPEYFQDRRPFAAALDGVAATMPFIADRCAATLPQLAERITTIPYGLPSIDRPRAPRGERLRLAYVGRLAKEQKRAHLLPDLLAAAVASGVDAELAILGGGPDAAGIAARFADLGVAGRVRFLGEVPPDEVAATLLANDVLVNLSDHEGHCMAAHEALMAGCVVARTAVASLDRRLYRDGENCLIAPVDRPLELAARIAELDGPTLERMSAAAAGSAGSLTEDAMVEAHGRLAEEMAAIRPLEPWPAEVALPSWDVSRPNRWRPRPHPLRRFVPTWLVPHGAFGRRAP